MSTSRPPEPGGASLDETDRLVLAQLGRDGRASYAEIGLLVNLSATAVRRRIDRLRARGVVRGFTVVLDPALLGWQTEAFVEVYCRERTAPRRSSPACASSPRWSPPGRSPATPTRWSTCGPPTPGTWRP